MRLKDFPKRPGPVIIHISKTDVMFLRQNVKTTLKTFPHAR